MALQINNRSPPVLLKHNERTMPQWVSEQSDRVGPKPPPPPPSPNLSKNLKNSQPLLPPKAKIQPEPDYEVIEFSQQQYSNAPLRTSSSGSSGAKTPDVKSKCTLCGSNNSWVTCEECAQQIFCTSCDDMFHKHPKRKNHIRKALEQCRPPLPPKTIPGQVGQLPPVAPPRRNKRGILTPLMQRKDQVNNCFGVRPAHTAPCSPLPSLRNNGCFHETDLDSSKNGSNIMNRPLPATPKTSTSQVMDHQSSRSNTPKSVFDSIQRPPSVTLEKIKTKANATLDRMQLLQQRYRHQKEHMEKEHDEICTNKQNHSPFEHWSNISSSPSHFRSGSISSGVNSSHLDLTDDSHFNLFNPHQMPQNETRNNHLTAGGLSTSVFNLHQAPLPRKSSIQGNSWIHGLPPAQSIAQLNCVKCNHTQHKPPQWSPNPGMVPIAYDPWSNQLNRQQNLNRSNLSLNVPGGYIIHHPIHQNMYPPPVFLNQNGLMTHMYPAPAHMGSMGSITNADIVGVPPVPSRSGSRMASPALSRKSVTLRRKQIQCFNNELTDDEGSDEDDRRSMISNRSGFSRYRQRRLSSASQYQVNKESESGHNRPHRQRFRDQRRNFPIRQQQANDWNSNKITSSSNSGRFLDSDFNSSIMSSRIYSDLDSEGSGTKALVQAKIEQKLKEEDQKKTKNKLISKTTKHTTGVQTSPIKLKTSQNSEEDAGESEILDKKGNKESLRKQKLEQPNHEENNEKDIGEEEATLLGPPPATPDYEWECEFCTFVNEADIKICSVCCKTPSKQPKKFGTNVAPAQQLSSEEHGMLKTQTVNNTINKTDRNFDKTNAQERSHDTRGSHTLGKQESLGDIWATLDENIQNTAQEVNRKTQTVSTNNDAILPVEHQEENTLVSNIAPPLSGNTRKNLNEASSMLESTTLNAPSSTNFNGNIHRLHKQYRSSVDLHCENSLPHTTDGVIYRNGLGRRQPSLNDLRLTSKVSPLNPYSSITDRMPESIVHNLAPIKGTDLYKYTPEELNAALKYSGPNVHPLMWLQEHWPKLITTVQSLATKYGQERIENTIGTISQMEARDALRLHTGNIWQAVTECIEERQRKYREISNAGNFSREDIVTALTIHQGNVDLALRDLERSQLKPFLMRIWGSPGGVENESGVLKQVNKTTTASQPSLNISKDIHDFLSVHVPECKPPPNTIEACHSNPSNATAHNNLSSSHMPDNTFNYSGFNKDFIPSCLQIDESILNNNNVLEDLETLIGRIEQQQQHKTTEELPTTIENEYDQEVQRVLTKSPIRMSKFKGPSKPKNELKQSDDVKNFMWQHIQEIVPNLVEQVEKELLSESNAPIKDPPPPPVDHDEFLLEEVIKPNLKIATIKEELSPTYKYAAEIDTFRMTFDKAIEKECSTCCEFQSMEEATKQVFYLYPSHATESNTVHTEVPSGIDQKGKEITSNQSEDALIFTITEELPSTSNSNYISKPISRTKSHSSIPVNSGRKAPPFKRATQSLTPEPSSDQFKLEKSNLSGTISGEVFKMQRKINEVEIEATTPEITSPTTENEKFNSKSKKLSKIPIRKTMNSKDFRTIFTNGQTPRTVQGIKKATENENELLMQKLPSDPNGQENIFTENNVTDTVDTPNSSEVVLMIQHVPTAPDISLAPATSTSTLHSLSSNSSDVKRTSNEFLLSSDSSKQNLTDLVKDTQRLIQQMRDEISLNGFVTSEESDLYTDEYDTDEYDDEDGYEEQEDDEVWVDGEEYNKEDKNAENINTNMQPGERELFEYISDSNSSELHEVKEKFIDNSASTELSILSKSLTNDHIKHNVNPENKFTFPVLINNTHPNKFLKDDNHEGPSISISSSNNLGETESMHQDGDHNSSKHLNTISSHLLENNKESGLSHNFETVDDTDREYFNKKNSFTISESSETAELDEKSRKTSKSHNNIAEPLTDNHASESSNNEENFSQLSQNATNSFENNVHTKRNNPKDVLDGFHKSILNDNHIPQQPEVISNDHVIENRDHDIEHFVERSALRSESNESKLSIIFVPLKESVSHISVCHILNSNLETENNHHDWLHNSDKQNSKSSLVSMDEQVLTEDMTMDRNGTKSPRNVHEFPGQKVLDSNEQNLPLHSEIKDNSKISTLSEGLYDHTKPELTLTIDCLPSSSKMARENLAKLQQQKLPSNEQLTHNNIVSIDPKPQESIFQTDSKFLENTPIIKFPTDRPTSPPKFIAAENVESVKLPGETSPPEHIPGSSSKAEKDKQSVKIQVKQSSKIPKPKEVKAKEQKLQIKKNLNTRSKSFSGPPPPVGITSVKTLRQELLKQTQKLTKSTSLQKQPPPLFVRKKSITDAITKLTKPTSNETYSNSKLFLSKSRTQPRIPKKKYHETCFSEDDYESSTSETEQSESWEMRQRKLSVPVFRTYPNIQTETDTLQTEELIEKFLKEELVTNLGEAQIAAALVSMKFKQDVSLWAAKECSELDHAIALLQQECELCNGIYPLNEIVSMLKCTHKCCKDCAKNFFTIQITERSINDCNCPFCKLPELHQQNEHEDENLEYFSNLDIFLKSIVNAEVHELFQLKLRDRTLLKDPNFKWCVQCSSGFFARPKQKRLICPDCGSVTCALCRKTWQKQHENISCEQFTEWLQSNDPDAQTLGVQQHLENNGIDCPKCKFRYSLSRGGCMHFTCTQCKFEFCYGCARPFMMGAKCNISPYCAKLGLHAHHPRNCLFYLRDKLPIQLQILLRSNGVKYEEDCVDTLGAEVTNSTKKTNRCPIPIQKETPSGLVDTVCNNDVPDKHAGLCRNHYVEYLTAKVAKANIDPLPIFDLTDCVQELRRRGIALPERGPWDTDEIYTNMCAEVIKQNIPLDAV